MFAHSCLFTAFTTTATKCTVPILMFIHVPATIGLDMAAMASAEDSMAAKAATRHQVLLAPHASLTWQDSGKEMARLLVNSFFHPCFAGNRTHQAKMVPELHYWIDRL